MVQDLQDGRLDTPGLTVEHFTGAAPMTVQDLVRLHRAELSPRGGPTPGR